MPAALALVGIMICLGIVLLCSKKKSNNKSIDDIFLTDGYTSGDPHYKTFDGKHYNFMGKCEYIFAKDCSEDHAFEVLQQNEACGSRRVSCTKSLRVLVQGIEVKMERRGIVYVDGIRVNLPWRMSSTSPELPGNYFQQTTSIF